MSDLIRWFGEQSEAVKLALIGLVGGVSAGFWASVKEFRKPVLQSVTTPTAPHSADDPVLLLLAEASAINVNLAELLTLTKSQKNEQDERIIGVIEEIVSLKTEIYLLRNILGNRGIGM